jgi:hypothetical protein
MNAAASRVETKVIAEDRIARIESDVAEIKDDVKTINIRLNESIVANAREFGAVRAELATHRTDTEKGFGAIRTELAEYRADTEKNFGAIRAELATHRTDTEKGFGAIRTELAEYRADTEKNFGAIRAEIATHRTDTEKGFGGLRVEIEKVRTSIVSAKLWMVLFCIVSLGSLLMSVLNFISHASRSP